VILIEQAISKDVGITWIYNTQRHTDCVNDWVLD